MFYNQNKEDVLNNLKTTSDGLSSDEAKFRLNQNGKNVLAEPKKKNILQIFWAQMKDLMIVVLLLAAVVSAVIAVIQKQYFDLIDSGIILVIVILNSIIGVIQTKRADKSMELLKNMNKPFAKVLRNGEILSINSEELVVGDIVLLEAGDSVPADLRLIETISLKIEESTLTGESLPQQKDDAVLKGNLALADRKNMAYSSTTVVYGRGKGVVVATGMDTQVGKIANILVNEKNNTTPLQGQLNKMAKILSLFVLSITFIIFGIMLIKNGFTIDNIIHSFMTAIAIAVAAIPEGLSATITIILALSVKEMSKKNAIVKHLQAVETLGCCQVVCSDKTGTLTMNRMTVKKLYTFDNGIFTKKDYSSSKSVQMLYKGMVLCNDSQEKHNGSFCGDPTEVALFQYFKENKINYNNIIVDYFRIGEYPFDSNRKMMTTIYSCKNKVTCYTKGALNKVLAKCNRILNGNCVREITNRDIEKIHEANNEMADKALRVLAFAVSYNSEIQNQEENLIFVGLVGMLDPPRPEVKNAVEVCKNAGVRPIMITGDQLNTAVAIAKEIGLFKRGSLAITGEELDKLSDEEFYSNLDKYVIFARVSPENKVRIVKAYKHFNLIVAMTGDGVNDAPSIKIADVGVGMGITGTDVSKEASDIILADDNFATIIGAVKEGRKTYSNIQKTVKYLLSANIAEVMSLLLVTLFMISVGQEFLTPIMILWINLITDSFPAIAFAYEKPDKHLMEQKPRNHDVNLLFGKTGLDIIVQGLIQTLLTITSYCIGNYAMHSHEAGMTMSFLTLSLIQLLHAYNCKSDRSLFSQNPFDNRTLNISFFVGVIFIILPIVVPFMAEYFGLIMLDKWQWIYSILCAVMVIPIVEIQKLFCKKIK